MRNPVRSDARKRRELLLDAAGEIFATQGYGAPLDSIAVRAGVGQGTLYRNFADRDELMFALLQRELSRLQESLRDTDPADCTLALVQSMAEESVVNPATCEYWMALTPGSPLLAAAEQQFYALAAQGLPAAKAAGKIRADLRAEDIGLVGVMFQAIRLGVDEAERRDVKRRVLTLLKEGIVP